jgi:hypothetical protein
MVYFGVARGLGTFSSRTDEPASSSRVAVCLSAQLRDGAHPRAPGFNAVGPADLFHRLPQNRLALLEVRLMLDGYRRCLMKGLKFGWTIEHETLLAVSASRTLQRLRLEPRDCHGVVQHHPDQPHIVATCHATHRLTHPELDQQVWPTDLGQRAKLEPVIGRCSSPSVKENRRVWLTVGLRRAIAPLMPPRAAKRATAAASLPRRRAAPHLAAHLAAHFAAHLAPHLAAHSASAAGERDRRCALPQAGCQWCRPDGPPRAPRRIAAASSCAGAACPGPRAVDRADRIEPAGAQRRDY